MFAEASPSSGEHSGIAHVRALDGLRGAAVVGVLLFHGGHLAGGYLGVDLFFVLSGFLITSLLLAEWRRNERVSLSAFWARRARRLLPALFLVVLGIAAYAAIVARPTELDRIRADAFATLGYVANWHSIGAGRDYWALFGSPSPFEHTWSLAIEEQFYLVWPLMFVGIGAVARARRRPIAPVVFAVAIVGVIAFSALAIILRIAGASDARVYFGTDTRAPAILLGVALAALTAWRGTIRSGTGRIGLEIVGLIGVGWLAWAWADLGGRDPMLLRGGLLISGVAGVAVLAAAAHPRRGPIAVAFSIAPLRWLGFVSYGLYLWHWPVFVWLSPVRTGLDGWGLTGVRVAVSLVFAVVSYTMVEMPIRRGALRGRRIQVAAPVAVAVTLIVVAIATAGAVRLPTTEDTVASGEELVASSPSVAPTAERILVVGDSVAYSLGVQFDALEIGGTFASFNAGVIACQIPRSDRHRAPFGTPDDPEPVTETPAICRDWPSRWSSQLAAVQPDEVLLALGFPAVADVEVDGMWYNVCEPEWRDYFRSEMGAALDLLESTCATVSVALVAPPPTPDIFPSKWIGAVECLNSVLRTVVAASPAHRRTIDLASYICPHGRCKTELGGHPLREDWVHYDGESGRIVARWLVDQMIARPHIA